jgi:hypothetical protein
MLPRKRTEMADIWSDPFYAPAELPQRMSSEELLAWYSYLVRDEQQPMKIRLEAGEMLASMLKLTGPAHVTNVLSQTTHNTVSATTLEEARQLVERLGARFRNLPAPSPLLANHPNLSTIISQMRSPSEEPSTPSGEPVILVTSLDRTK